MDDVRDDTGHAVDLPHSPRRIVSLVPSLTETVAVSAPELLVGATDWCIHPRGLDVPRIGGTKNPDVGAIVALAPDLVLANEEENRIVDLDALRRHGIAVWVTRVRSVDEGLSCLRRMLQVCGVGEPAWLVQAEAAWAAGDVGLAQRRRAVVPIWRRPWMTLGRDTFAGDVLRRLGVDNVMDDDPERYPRVELARLPEHDLVVLPGEPYAFSADDGPEAFPDKDCALVSGRHLTWYGPSLVEAAEELTRSLRDVLPAGREMADG